MKDLKYQPYLDKISGSNGFIAALDQSGGSTPKALRLYGITESEYSNEEEMYEKVHQMRSRIITSKSFTGDRILGAILFEKTMNGEISGMDTAHYLWNKKKVVPFLKVDKGLEEVNDGVQLMKPNPGLEDLLDQAVNKDIFGTKMRSVIKDDNEKGVASVVEQQFEIAKIIIQKNLVPIIEPEVDIHCEKKSEAEQMLFENLKNQIEKLTSEQKILLKLTIPDEANLYAEKVKNHLIEAGLTVETDLRNEKMGAKIRKKGSKVEITGVKEIYGAELMATDLRASSCLIIAGLMAKGKTIIKSSS